MSSSRKVVFFDGECALCSSVVRWCHRRDSSGQIFFAALSGDFAAEYRADLNLPEGTGAAQTFAFWDEAEGSVYLRSSGAVYLLKELGGFWMVLGNVLWLIPVPIRDFCYGIIAKNRRRWFARGESCSLPPGSLRGQVLD